VLNQVPLLEYIWGSGVIAPCILNLCAKWRWVVSIIPWPLYPQGRERAPSTYYIGGWVGPEAGLDMVVKRKSPSPSQDSNPGCPACRLVTTLTELFCLFLFYVCMKIIFLCFVFLSI